MREQIRIAAYRRGETFSGTITGVTGFGIFVTLDEVYVEGLVHISEFGQDYFHFDQAKHAIIGERTKKKFQLSDRVNIKVARVDIETSKIDFSLAGELLKRSVATDEKADDSKGKFTPWNAGKKKIAKAAVEKGVKAPSAPPQVLSPPPLETRQSREAKADKTVINVSSANPPTTPMAGFGTAAAKGKAPPKPKVVSPPASPAPKARKTAALLAKKKK